MPPPKDDTELRLRDESRKMIQETHDTVIEIKTALPYMAEDIKNNKERIEDLGSSHGKLKRNFWLLIGILGGSGVIGGSVYGVLNGG